MRFESLEIVANGPNGWGSGLLEFGSDITQLFAENESGRSCPRKWCNSSWLWPLSLPFS